MKTTNGATYKRFLTDDRFWTDIAYCDGETITINGKLIDEFEVDPKEIKDEDIVTFDGGYITYVDEDSNEPRVRGFEQLFSKGLKSQTKVCIVVSCERESLEAVTSAVKSAGGEVQ